MFRAHAGHFPDGQEDLGAFPTEDEAWAAIGRRVATTTNIRHVRVVEDGEPAPRVWSLPAPPDDVDVLYPVRPRLGVPERWERRADWGANAWASMGNGSNGGMYHWGAILETGAVTDVEPARAQLAPGVWTARLPIALGGRTESGPDIAAGEQIVLLEPGGGNTWHVMTINGDRARAATRVLEGALLEDGATS